MKIDDLLLENLLSKYCIGTISGEELRVLSEWMNESEHNKKLATDLLRTYRSERAYHAYNEINETSALTQIMLKVGEIKKRRRLLFLRNIAASLTLLIVCSITAYYFLDKQPEAPPFLAEEILPGSSRAILVLSDGNQIDLEESGDSAIVGKEGEKIKKTHALLDYQGTETRKEVFNTIYTPRGGEYSLVLSDGTKVWLNADSQLSYPVKFIGQTRKVNLKGEAYFEVAHNPQSPFIVELKNSSVEALGTSFNIRSYSDEAVTATTLVEGKVKVVIENNQAILEPGNQAIFFDQGETIEVKNVDPQIFTSWKDGLFIFRKRSMNEIFCSLSKWYDFEVVYENPELKALHFSGDLEKYQTITTHLQMIEMTTHIRFEIKGKTVYVKKTIE